MVRVDHWHISLHLLRMFPFLKFQNFGQISARGAKVSLGWSLVNIKTFVTDRHWDTPALMIIFNIEVSPRKQGYGWRNIICTAYYAVQDEQSFTSDMYVGSTTCWNNLQDLWERSPRFAGIWARKKISKICWNNLQDLWECGREKKIPKICGRDFLAYTREKKSTRFVGEIFTRFSSLSPRKKIHKICGRDFHKIF